MSKTTITTAILTCADKLKPVLKAILPIKLRRFIQRKLVIRNMNRIAKNSLKPFDRAHLPDGITLIGYIRGEIGLGQSCRLVARALDDSNLPFTIYNYNQIRNMRQDDPAWDRKITDTAPYNVNLVHINTYDLPLAFLHIGANLFSGRYNIAFWLWELEEFPKDWENALTLVDEIWTPSEFSSASIRKITEKPVLTVPYPLDNVPVNEAADRAYFSLPEDVFLCLCMYDCNSIMERKNPIGAIEAFKQAFDAGKKDVGLIVKVNNPQKADLGIINEALKGYPNIYVIADILGKPEVNALISCADVYISLHRAEGFGLVMAEAMALGTVCVATDWSSNTEFMNEDVACMVDYSFTTIQKTVGPYEKGERWAEPDTEQAADYLRRLYNAPAMLQSLADKAKVHITQHYGTQQAAARIEARITEIYDM